MGNHWRRVLATAATVLCGISTACDETFAPVEPSANLYSVFGFLDASADTQWIRVMPVREVATTSPDLPATTAFLEEQGSGRRIELRDSLFHFPAPNPNVNPEGVFVRNFWTTEPILLGETYRFVATMAGAEPAVATVEIPQPYDIEVWVARFGSSRLIVNGVQHIGFASFITRFSDPCGETWMYRPFHLTAADSGEHSIQIRPIYSEPFRVPSCGETVTLWDDLVVFGSVTRWPAGVDQATGNLGVPDIPSNLTNAVGFLGGVVSRRVPFELCSLVGVSLPQYCELRYDSMTSVVSGTVSDACGSILISPTIQMEELGDAPVRRIRTASPRNGTFTIMALEGPLQYEIRISNDGFRPHTDTIHVAPGQRLTYDAVLTGFPCDS